MHLAVIICKIRITELRFECLPFLEIPVECIKRQHVQIFSVIRHVLSVETFQSFPAVKVEITVALIEEKSLPTLRRHPMGQGLNVYCNVSSNVIIL